MLYGLVLFLHSWVRWVVVIGGLVAAARGIAGLFGRRPWTRSDDRWGAIFVHALELQVVIGLVLYFVLSPITRAGMRDFGAAMKDGGLRFWTVEHAFGMIVAIALASIGRGRIRRATDAARKHRTAAIFFTIALLAILASVPWPGWPQARPLFRW